MRNSNNPISGFVLFAIRDFSSKLISRKNSVAEKSLDFYAGNMTMRPFFEKRLDFELNCSYSSVYSTYHFGNCPLSTFL